MLSTYVDGQCGKLVTVISHQFIALTVDICVQHGRRVALRRAGLSAAAETCFLKTFNHRSTEYYCRLSTDQNVLGLRSSDRLGILLLACRRSLNDVCTQLITFQTMSLKRSSAKMLIYQK